MKMAQRYAWVLLLSTLTLAHAQDTPVSKAVALLTDLQKKVAEEHKQAEKAHVEGLAMCKSRSKDLGFEIQTGESAVAELQANMENEQGKIVTLGSTIEELGANIANNQEDLKAATAIRTTEAANFAAEEKELLEIVDTLERSIGILQKEQEKGGTALLQVKNAGHIAQVLAAMVQASSMTSADAATLSGLIQGGGDSNDGDSDAVDADLEEDAEVDMDASALGAPSASVYENQSGGIIETMESLLEKAHEQLDALRTQENSAMHNYAMLKQSLEDEIKVDNDSMATAKGELAEATGRKATYEADLGHAATELQVDKEALKELQLSCQMMSDDYVAEKASRDEEMKVLAEAQATIQEMTKGASSISYGSEGDQDSDDELSFLQESLATTSDTKRRFKVLKFMQELAKQQHDTALAKLASRVAAAMQVVSRDGKSNANPFEKVKGLITDMISRLQEEAAVEQSKKAYCDKEMSQSEQKKAENTAAIDKLTTRIDRMSAGSTQLKEEVAQIQKEVAKIVAAQAAMDTLRKEEHDLYTTSKADMEQGLQGVALALKMLREYYSGDDKAHTASEGAGSGIIGMLEVIESDFSKDMARIVVNEQDAQATYEKETQENNVEKATKQQDIDYKSKESVALDKSVSQLTSDRESVQDQLDAVNEYLKKLEETCVAKAETYEERSKRREEEIAGLKEALEILSGEPSLLQLSSRKLKVKRHNKPTAHA